MKVAVIGGGSSYTPELINGFLERVGSFPLTELWLMDIAQERLDVVGGFAQRIVQAKRQPGHGGHHGHVDRDAIEVGDSPDDGQTEQHRQMLMPYRIKSTARHAPLFSII